MVGPPDSVVLGALRVAVVVVDGAGRVVSANPQALDILCSDDVIGTDVRRWFPALDTTARVSPAERRSVEFVSGGAQRRLGFHIDDVLHQGARFRAVVFQDITELTRIRAERDRLLQLAALAEVVPGVLHDLKTPLAAVVGAVELVLEDSAPGTRRALMTDALAELHRLRLTIDGLGALGRELHAGWDSDVRQSVLDVVSVVAAQAERRGVLLVSSVGPMPQLPFDPVTVRAVVFNLLMNAVEACSPGDRIELSAALQAAGSQFSLRVSDTGAGMPEAVRLRASELFYTTKPTGSGIGLTLCDRVARAQGGFVRIDSQPGAGTTVELTVPVRQAGAADAAAAPLSR